MNFKENIFFLLLIEVILFYYLLVFSSIYTNGEKIDMTKWKLLICL